MQILINGTANNKRTVLTELYEKYWRDVKSVCICLLMNDNLAEKAVVWSFCNVWSSVLNGKIETEEVFKQRLLEKAVIYCRRRCQKKGQNTLPIPSQKNFIVSNVRKCQEKQSVWKTLLEELPLAGRFVFVLHKMLEFDKEKISEITGLKIPVVEAALAVEDQNIARTYVMLGQQAYTTSIDKEIKNEIEDTKLSEEAKKQILESIDILVRPLIKAERRKKFLNVGIGILAILLVGIVIVVGKSCVSKMLQEDETKQESSSSDASSTEIIDESTSDTAVTGADEITATHYAEIAIENYGTITVALDGNTAPETVENFVTLAKEGFYDGLTFHRIIEGFMMQGGDPKGDGTGGSEDTIIGEFSENGVENPLSHTRGAISMARSEDYDSASSQFFIVHKDSTSLDGQYAVFGYVTEGMDIVDEICESAEPTDDNGTIPSDQQPIITSVSIKEA